MRASFKESILFVHRWVGLATGVVVFIVSITGCLFVFHQEISRWTRSELLYVDAHRQQTLPVRELQQKAARALGVDRLPYGLTTYKNPSRTWSALLYKGGGKGWTYFGTIKAYRTLYINPYNGEIAGIVNEEKDFFQIVKGLHWSLLLATPIGQPIVVWSTAIFIVLLVTGLVLWWPRRWNDGGRRQCFRIKWKGTWKRVNYDLHNVLGFYFLVVLLVIAFTGLYWYFPVAKKSLYFLGTGEFELPPAPAEKVVSTPAGRGAGAAPVEIAYATAWSEYPRAYSITFTAPADSQGTIRAAVRPDGETYYRNSVLHFDQYTGELLREDTYSEKDAGEKLLAMNYDIHVGAIGGLPGKIVAFLASLLSASLPVTGFIIWLPRWRRKRRRRRAAAAEHRPASQNGTDGERSLPSTKPVFADLPVWESHQDSPRE